MIHRTLIGLVDAVHILAPIGRFHRRRVSVLQEQVAGLLKRNARLQDKVRSLEGDAALLNGHVARLEEEIVTLEAEAIPDEPIPYRPIEGSPELTLAESPGPCIYQGGKTEPYVPCKNVCESSACENAYTAAGRCKESDIHYPWRYCARDLPCPYHLPSEKFGAAAKSIGARNVDANGAPVEEEKPVPEWAKTLAFATALFLPVLGVSFPQR